MAFKSNKDKQVAYNIVFNSEQGKAVLEDLMTYCHMLEPDVNIHDANKRIDPNAIIYRAGRRDVAMNILLNMNCKIKDLPKKMEDSHG